MSISYTEVLDKEILRKATFRGVKEYVIAKANSDALNRCPFASDYEFSSCFLPKKYLQAADCIFNFAVRPDDVWVAAFPKSGSTWLSNIVWQLQHNFDFTAKYLYPNYKVLDRMIWMEENEENENDLLFQEYKSKADCQINEIDHDASPRLIKSHLPAHLLPTGVWTVEPKLIYVYRNVKDVAVSSFHMFSKHEMSAYKGSMEDWFDSFLSGNVIFGPLKSHLKSYQQLERLDHVLILTYEEMLANPFAEIKRISEFLNYTYSDDQLRRLEEHVSFSNMQSSKTNLPLSDGFNFYRKGKANSYRDEMSPEYARKFDDWESETKNK